MPTAVPDPIDLTYAKAQYDIALQALETATLAAATSSQGRSWSPQPLEELRRLAGYWAVQVKRLKGTSAGERNPIAAVARFGSL